MSEKFSSSAENIASAESLEVLGSGGARLRKAREAANLQVAALAALLKVPEKKLEALEADRFDLLPDTIFVRALAASICRTLKIDPAPILELLPHSETPTLKSDESGINTPFRTAGTGTISDFLNNFSKPLFIVVLGLLLGAAVLFFSPKQDQLGFIEIQKTNNLNSSTSISAQTPTPAQTLRPELIVAAPMSNVGGGEQVSLAPTAAASLPSSTAVTLPADAGAAAATVVFKARDTSWVEVVDANGVVQARKTMTQGEVVTVSANVPLAVVVGRADNVEVLVKGQPFDLLRLAKDNVARFEVK